MTVVNGRIVVRDGELLTMDSKRSRKNARKIAGDIVRRQRENV